MMDDDTKFYLDEVYPIILETLIQEYKERYGEHYMQSNPALIKRRLDEALAARDDLELLENQTMW